MSKRTEPGAAKTKAARPATAARPAAAPDLRLTQVKSAIGFKSDQGATLRALGLGKVGRSVEQVSNPAVRGMIFKVKHLIKVEEI